MIYLSTEDLLRELVWLVPEGTADKATISTMLGCVQIEVGCREVELACRGDLPGAFVVDSRALRNLLTNPPGTADIRMTYVNGKMYIGSMILATTRRVS
jgi:hypothetical protein